MQIRPFRPKNALAFILVISMVLAGVTHPGFLGWTSYASDTSSSDTISDIQKQQKELEKKINDAQDDLSDKKDELSDIYDEGREIDKNLGELNIQMAAIDMKISAANKDITETENDIKTIEAEMAELKAHQDARYEIMKRHIVFFYENRGQTDVVSIFCKSGSFAEFLNRTEMISAIVDYDKALIQESEAVREELQKESDALELQQERLASRKKDLKASQKEMDELIASVQKEAKENEKDAKKAKKAAKELAAKIKQYETDKEVLQAAEAQAQAELAKQLAEAMEALEAKNNGVREDTTGAYAASASDVTLLAATIEAEAGNQSYFGQQAVASVIMNRVKSSLFPNTIFGVISQENQFQPYRQGIVDAFIKRGPNEQCIEIAQKAIDGERVGDWLFFMTVPSADSFGITGYEVIGDHAFFYKWGAN